MTPECIPFVTQNVVTKVQTSELVTFGHFVYYTNQGNQELAYTMTWSGYSVLGYTLR